MAVHFEARGEWTKTFRFLERAADEQVVSILEKYAQKGVDALRAGTPKRTGLTAYSWSSSVNKTGTGWEIVFNNSNTNKGVNIAFIIQQGHGTGTGGYVTGIDYINPALEPIFHELADEAFREVTSA